MFEINNTMVQENRQEIWCAFCKNENTEQCKYCVFAGTPTRYEFNKPIIERK